jgi:hypothetical protein
VPLPCSKLLWEARNEEIWNTEVETEKRSNGIFGLLHDGRLMRLKIQNAAGRGALMVDDSLFKDDPAAIKSQSEENWVDWAAGMDGIGYLIMVAASLL